MKKINNPEKISTYFKMEWLTLILVSISGLFYNIGLLAGPLFEGKLAQCLMDVLKGTKVFSEMFKLAVGYVFAIAAVQIARYIKRLYVRRFANNVNRSMKHILYGNLIHKSKAELEKENIGNVITKAISDVDACVEGMRKFTTEIFDTGVALICYAVLLLCYDWRLALLSLIFPPFSYLIAEKMKVIVQRTGAFYKESSGRLNAATLDRVSGAVSYRVFGCEEQRDQDYEVHLKDYEQEAVMANIWVSALPPLYHVISMLSVLFILYFGTKNVLGTGWTNWDIAAFTTFLSCFAKMSVKSSKAAKLFNAVQKAQVSWKRIRPLMKKLPEEHDISAAASQSLHIKNLSVVNAEGIPVFEGLSLDAKPGEIIGITGPVACGKSTLGKAFLCERDYFGSICLGRNELSQITSETRQGIVGYLGHDTELMSDTIQNNVLLGLKDDSMKYLQAVCFDTDLQQMPEGVDTRIGSGGILLSGGQQQRGALARTLAHPKPLYVLDDPFSALDKQTEKAIFENLKVLAKDSIVILISHRLYLFPQLDQVIWMENGKTITSTHQELLHISPLYEKLYEAQLEGGEHNED